MLKQMQTCRLGNEADQAIFATEKQSKKQKVRLRYRTLLNQLWMTLRKPQESGNLDDMVNKLEALNEKAQALYKLLFFSLLSSFFLSFSFFFLPSLFLSSLFFFFSLSLFSFFLFLSLSLSSFHETSCKVSQQEGAQTTGNAGDDVVDGELRKNVS